MYYKELLLRAVQLCGMIGWKELAIVHSYVSMLLSTYY